MTPSENIPLTRITPTRQTDREYQFIIYNFLYLYFHDHAANVSRFLKYEQENCLIPSFPACFTLHP